MDLFTRYILPSNHQTPPSTSHPIYCTNPSPLHPLNPLINRHRHRQKQRLPPALQIPLRRPVLGAPVPFVHVDERVLPRLFFGVVAVIADAVEEFVLVGFEGDEGADFVFVLLFGEKGGLV